MEPSLSPTTCLVVKVNEPSEFSKDEDGRLARPCLDMLNRLTYEVKVKFALDLPGINLSFNQ